MLKKILLQIPFLKKNNSAKFKLLGYKTGKNVYEKALTHKSFSDTSHNEQLEFLGDSVLSFLVAEQLFLDNPEKEEGYMSKKRAIIVSRKHLNMVGGKIIAKKQIKSQIKELPSNIFGNTLEAVIGAIYIDKGLSQARVFVKKHIYKSEFLQPLLGTDFKSKLLKLVQKEKIKIKYKTKEKEGPSKQEQKFMSTIFLNGKKTAEGVARSKKEAEQQAAKKTIKNLFYS